MEVSYEYELGGELTLVYLMVCRVASLCMCVKFLFSVFSFFVCCLFCVSVTCAYVYMCAWLYLMQYMFVYMCIIYDTVHRVVLCARSICLCVNDFAYRVVLCARNTFVFVLLYDMCLLI